MVRLGNQKNVFWEAALLTLIIFIFGIFIGIAFEANKIDEVNEYYAISEISLMDIFVFNSLLNFEDINCENLIEANIKFADKIYEEAYILEQYEDSGKLSDNIRLAHDKYDILRTFLWVNSIETSKKCEDSFSIVVYLYEYEPTDLTKKATQKVWSRILLDLKQKEGNNLLLIPIATDNNLVSLNSKIQKLEITKFPVVIIDDVYLIEELHSLEDLEKYLN